MKTALSLWALAVSAMLPPWPANAAGYVTTFDEYIPNHTLSGQDGGTGVFWDTNNYAIGLGQSDYAGIISGYSTTVTDYWALLGGAIGVAPVVDNSYLFRPLDATGASFADFSVRFGMIASQIPRSTRDTFGWALRNAAGNSLLRVRFIPHPTQLNQLTVRVYDANGNELAGSGLLNIFYNAKYDLHMVISNTNQVMVTLGSSLGEAPHWVVKKQPLNPPGGPSPVVALIHDVAATWELTDTTELLGIFPNFGSNSLVFNNLVVSLSASALPNTYSDWASQAFVSAPGADTSPTADPDGDGVNNLIEYGLLRNPVVPEGSPVQGTVDSSGNIGVEFRWNIHAADLGCQLIGSNNLAASIATWPVLNFDVVNQQIDGDVWKVTLRPASITGSRYFFSVRVNETPP